MGQGAPRRSGDNPDGQAFSAMQHFGGYPAHDEFAPRRDSPAAHNHGAVVPLPGGTDERPPRNCLIFSMVLTQHFFGLAHERGDGQTLGAGLLSLRKVHLGQPLPNFRG